MRWPIRHQIFVPFALLLLAAVLGGAVWSSLLSARYAGTLETQRLRGVIEALQSASFPYTETVLDRMRGLSGAEFVAIDPAGAPIADTFAAPLELPDDDDLPALSPVATSLSDFPTHQIGDRTYFVTRVDSPGQTGPRRLYVFYPRDHWEQLQWDSAWPALVAGGVSLLLMLAVSGWIAHRISQRVGVVQGLFAELEAGRFPQLAPPTVRDELGNLVESANHLSARLEHLRNEVARTERLRTLAQLAAGLAHQLRNAITGARMGIQLHQRRCTPTANDETLTVALAQLKLTEQQVQGLLSLSREPSSPPVPGELTEVLREVEQLVSPQVQHLKIEFRKRIDLATPCPVCNRDGLRGGLLNLVLNGIEAAGIGGEVTMTALEADGWVQVEICDSGAGPPPEIAPRLLEPFVTSKPEGVGLGLMLAQQAAIEEGGQLTWCRRSQATCFLLKWPTTATTVGLSASRGTAAVPPA